MPIYTSQLGIIAHFMTKKAKRAKCQRLEQPKKTKTLKLFIKNVEQDLQK